MSADDLDLRMERAARECGSSETLYCTYASGHDGPCWSSGWERWGGLSTRCYANRGRAQEACIRAANHKGPHEGPDGATWRRR